MSYWWPWSLHFTILLFLPEQMPIIPSFGEGFQIPVWTLSIPLFPCSRAQLFVGGFLSLFIITLLLYLWSNPLNQLPPASFTRPMASYINIFLTRTVNCLLTKQKSYWQEPHANADMGLSLCLQREAGSFCGKKEKKTMPKTDFNVQPLLRWVSASVSAKVPLLNVLVHFWPESLETVYTLSINLFFSSLLLWSQWMQWC